MSRKGAGPAGPGAYRIRLDRSIFSIFLFFHKKSPGEIDSPGLIPATGQPAASGLTMAGGLAGRRPIVGGRLIDPLLGRIIPLLRLLIVTLLLLRLIGGLRLPVESSGYATPGSPEQTADSRPLPGIVVIDWRPRCRPLRQFPDPRLLKGKGLGLWTWSSSR